MAVVNITEELLDAIDRIVSSELTEADDHQVRRCLLDYIGCAVGGSLEYAKVEQAVALFGMGSRRILGLQNTVSVVGSAFSNGFCSHVLELDDGHRRAMQHLGAPVFSVLFAFANESTSWQLFAKAVVAGYETAVALGEAMQPRHKLEGFHATGTCGTIGATIAACVLMGYDRIQMRRAISAAATSAAGLLEVIGEGSALKPYNVAHACAAAAAAVGMAEGPCNGPNDVLGGKRGFLTNYGGDPSKLTFGSNLRIHEIYTKPYSACRHCHSPIECVEKIMAETGVAAGDVVSIRVDTYDLAVFGHDQKKVANASEAKMSTPFGIASVLCGKGAYMDAYVPANIADERIVRTMGLVEVLMDAELTAACPEKRGARVSVELKDGSKQSCLVEYPKGEPENAMTDGDLGRKAFGLILAAGFNEDDARRIVDTVWMSNDIYKLVLMCCKCCKE